MNKRALYTRGLEFFDVVKRLRAMPSSELRFMALFAAEFWSDDELRGRQADKDLPGNPGVLNVPLNS
jgi:hypothetical protein